MALVFPWATYLAVLTRPEFEESEERVGRSFPIGATVVAGAGVVVFATGAHLALLDPLLERLQTFGLGGVETAREQAAALGERAAEARLETVQKAMAGKAEQIAGLARARLPRGSWRRWGVWPGPSPCRWCCRWGCF
ncbi:MAG: hypothetical protein ABEK42_02535 [Thiohalorhabdaceae bacterium]